MTERTDAEWHGPGPDPDFVRADQAHILENNQPPFFRRWTIRELQAQASKRFEWTIKGLLPSPSYGPIGGAKKSLKSWVGQFLVVGLASGKPIFDTFVVPQAWPVVAYVGEGGSRQFARRLERVAKAMGVRLDDLPLIPTFDTGAILGGRFLPSLYRDLEELEPGLVWVDPLYVYQGSDVKSSDLYDRGAMLSAISGPCVEANASLLIGDHFNKNGAGDGLSRLTQAGMGEWADSWLLLAHRGTGSNVELGHFELRLDVGSRQWGEKSWDLDLNIGRFDMDRGEHIGDVSWLIAPATERLPERDRTGTVKEVLAERPWSLTKSQVLALVSGNSGSATAAFDDLAERGEIVCEAIARDESGQVRTRTLWALATQPRPQSDLDGPG